MLRTPLVLSLVLFVSTAPLEAQCEVDEILPGGVATIGGAFGTAVDISGNLAIVGAPSQAASPFGTGGAFLFEKQPVVGWVGGVMLTPGDIAFGDELGAAVAIEGTVAVIANPGDDDFGADSGSVYVYEYQAGTWLETAKLNASDAVPGGRFGASIDMDGSRLVVGSPGAAVLATGGFSKLNVGAAYVFERVGPGAWIQISKLDDASGLTEDGTGAAVAISGSRIVVGAPGQDMTSAGAGAAYVFNEFTPATFSLEATLLAPDATASDAFGAAVDIDGDRVVVGAPADSDVCTGCGSAYVFQNVGPGTWIELLKIGEGGVIDGELLANDNLGAAVAISGKTVAVGAPANFDGGFDSGSVFIYKLGLSGLVKTNKLNACDASGADEFGAALAMEAGTLVIGAPGVDDIAGDAGSAYFFSPDVIQIGNPNVEFLFSDPDLAAAIPIASPPAMGGDPQCSEAPLFPRIEIADLFDNNPLYVGHRFVHRGRLWDMYLVEHPIPSNFTFDSYDVTDGDEIYAAHGGHCDPEVDFDITYDHLDPVSGETGTLTTFVWTECYAENDVAAQLGPFEVTVEAFVPDGGGVARFDLGATNSGTSPADWAFWAGRVNMSLVEKHPDPPEDIEYYLLTPFGHLVTNPALNLIGDAGQNIPTRADALGRPSNQAIGFYDEVGRGLYAAMSDESGNRAKNFQFFGCPGDGTIDPSVNISSISYHTDVSPDVDFQAVSSSIGRFRGDWYDLAALYRQWIADYATFTSNGLVKDRTDVPEFAKQIQMATVLGVGAAAMPPIPPASGGPWRFPAGSVGGPLSMKRLPQPGQTLAERLETYMDHWGIDRMTTAQFGTEWAGGCPGVGDYEYLETFAPIAEAMQDKEDELAALGKELKYMTYFLDIAYATEGDLLDWESLVIRQPSGDPIQWTPGGTCGTSDIAMLDPSTQEWQDHVFEVARQLGELGVDGIYCDNAFPELTQYDFSTTHGHAPGYGPYMTEGFGDMFDSIQGGGQLGNTSPDPDFITYTEFFFEGFIPRSDTYGPEQAWTDWMTGDGDSVQVPLMSTLYHHYTVLGPPFVGYYTHDLPPFNYDNNVLNLYDPAERADGRIGANFTMSYGWVNGCPIWSPDPGMAAPMHKKLSFELDETELRLTPGTFDELRAVCAYGAELARVRGYPLAMGFLNTGRRLRDLDVTTTPATVPVVLSEIYNPYNITTMLGPETEDFPPVLHGVWRDLDTGAVGLALANYTAQQATADFTFKPADYNFSGPVTAYTVTATGETVHTGPFTEATQFNLTLGGETTLFLRFDD